MTIFNLQILRGLAALGVVFYHTGYPLAGDWHTEFFGVSTFFVISGFIMCFITRDPNGGDADAQGFLTRRAIRIVPLYWLFTLALVLMSRHETDIPLILRSFTFYPPPEGTMPLLSVGWTLNFEVYFYVVFAIALLINRGLAPLIAWAIVYAVIRANDYGIDSWLIKFYSHSYVHFFLYGIGLFYVWWFTKDFLKGWARWPTIIICAATVIGIYGSQFIPPQLPVYAYGATYFPVLLVAAALFAASAGGDITWRPAILIGDASYAIYLTHQIGFRLFSRFVPPLLEKENLFVMLSYVIATALIGIGVHLWIEKPMLKLIRQYSPARKVELKALVAEKN
jgi:exopolysaccharide production protein ExoZ